ncbi:MAG: Xaa-Pro dipeptidyl-peptidase [Bacteroidota bacterium]
MKFPHQLASLIACLFLFVPFSFGQDSTSTKAQPIFENGEAQIVEAFSDPAEWIIHDLWVETEFDTDGDGKLDRMHVDVFRPMQTETEGLKLPVIYNTSPYFAGVSGNQPGTFWNVRHEIGEQPPKRSHPSPIKRRGERPIISKRMTQTWVPRGFVVVHSSSPGTGLSEGVPTVGGDNESLAPKAVIDWLCGRTMGYTSVDGQEEVKAYWSTGKVGMTGTSYNGTLPIAAATTGVEGLEAIIPVSPNTSYYHYYRANGLVRSPGGYLGEDVDVLYDFIHSGPEEKRPYGDANVRDKEMKEGMDRITGDYNDFWEGRDYLNKLDKYKAATLFAHGFNDWNVMPDHTNRIYQAVKKKGIPTQIYWHQFGHGGEPPLSMMNRWFTRYLHGVENGVEKDAQSWIVREGDPRDKPTPYDAYPHPEASSVKLYLAGGAPAHGKLNTSADDSQGKETVVDNFSFDGAALADAEYTNHRLMYTSEVLNQDLHISGTPSVTIKVASNKKAANLSVWLVSLPWIESRYTLPTDNVITRGWADIQNYKSLRKSKPLKEGKFYEVTFNLEPDDQIIRKGQRIGLMIFSSDKDYTLRPDPGTELTIDLEGTSLLIPIVGGKEQYIKAISDQ